MRRLGIERAHIVGHSSSAVVALQLALDSPEAVHTLVLMEPARPVPPTEAQEAFVRDFVAPAVRRYRAGDRAGAVDTFARGVFGADYRGPLEQGLPGVFEQAVADADAFFGQELPPSRRWTFTGGRRGRITQPVLAVLGEHTAPTFPERLELLFSWLPNVEPFELPAATHLLHLQQPSAMAEGLAAFFARHPAARHRRLVCARPCLLRRLARVPGVRGPLPPGRDGGGPASEWLPDPAPGARRVRRLLLGAGVGCRRASASVHWAPRPRSAGSEAHRAGAVPRRPH